MKNKPLKPTHTIVLSIAILLTVFSIIGSIAAAGLIPFVQDVDSLFKKESTPSTQESNLTNNQRHDVTTHKNEYRKIEFNGQSFQSSVKPKLWSCFNCGVVTAIESIFEDEYLAFMNDESGLLNYLEAHRENARIIALDDSKDSHTDQLHHQSEDQQITYLIKVRMHDGTQHIITQDNPPKHEVGDKVRLTVEKLITA